MSYRNINRLIAFGVFVLTLVMYRMTAQPTVAYWDCAEYAATSAALEIPHPPGAPFFTLLGRIAMMTPFVKDLALRINLISALASASTIMFLYLIGVRITSRWRRFPSNLQDAVIVFGSALIGALTLSVSDTFWFNAVESDLFATSIFFISCTVWLGMVWFDEADKPGGKKYLLLIAYLIGLSVGVHQLCLLSFFTIAVLIYFRYFEFEWHKFLKFCVVAVTAFLIVYPVIVKWFVDMLGGNLNAGPFSVTNSQLVRLIPAAAIVSAAYGIWRAERARRWLVSTSLTAGLLIVLGYSTYALVYIRANANPPLNQNNPSTLQKLVSYLNREQYGTQPIFWPRRWSYEARYQSSYAKYSSDWDYFWSYQVNHMFLRYLGWNFIGRAGDLQDAPVALLSAPKKWHDGYAGFPTRYFAIPFLLALFGIWYHFKKDWKIALAFLAMFLVMGFALAVYFNMAEPQPRERDYFFVGAFFVFALWSGIGASGIIDFVGGKIRNRTGKAAIISATAVALFVASPLNMFAQNLYSHDRHDNFAPFDVSYDILQSCPPNAVLFTGGDNDTFPLWYLQEALGIRTDVRIVCLSLANTDWYDLQLKNDTPHGAQRVPIGFTDQQIEEIANAGAVEWQAKTFKLAVPEEAYRRFGVADTSVTNRAYIQYTIDPTIRQGNITGIRVQDLITKNIIDTNKWRRPICFAVSVAPGDCIGLQNYFEMQGLVNVLTPVAHKGVYYDAINVPITRQCLLDQAKEHHTTPHYGFVYANLNKPGTYYDSNARNMISALREPFITLSAHYQSNGDSRDCIATLDTMEAKIPAKDIPMDYGLLSNIARLYYLAGAQLQFHQYAEMAERGALAAIESNPNDVQGYYNPYSILLGLYDMEGAYQKSIQLLQRLQTMFPNDQGIAARIRQLEEMVMKLEGRKSNAKSETQRPRP